MLSLEHITVQFGGRVLFDDLTALISPHDRVGLVGSNGTGKSTLLKVIAGLQLPESGNINKAQYVTVGYLPQDGVAAQGKTLYEETATAFENILAVQEQLEEAEHNLATLDPMSEAYADTLEVFGELHHKLEDLDAYRMKSNIEQVLVGLGFGEKDFERQTDEFSGGWQMRIALAKLLLREPNVLLLDEPTNHLDIRITAMVRRIFRSLQRRHHSRFARPCVLGQHHKKNVRAGKQFVRMVRRQLFIL